MIATVIQPSADLRPFVKRFMVVDTEAGDVSTLLPDTSMVLGFRFDGSGVQEERGRISMLPRFVMSGLRDTVRTVTHAKGGIMLTVFSEIGAAAFLKEPVDSLFNASIPFDCLVDETILRPLEDRLVGAEQHAQRAEAMEQFLMSQLRLREGDYEVTRAVAAIQRAHGNLKIEELARAMGLSQSALERRFRKAVGTSPKQFASISRLQYVSSRYAAGGSLSEIAHDAGYFDQPHFVKDFKAFTGQPPDAFFRTTRLW